MYSSHSQSVIDRQPCWSIEAFMPAMNLYIGDSLGFSTKKYLMMLMLQFSYVVTVSVLPASLSLFLVKCQMCMFQPRLCSHTFYNAALCYFDGP